ILTSRLELLHHEHGREQVANVVGPLRKSCGVLFDRRLFAVAPAAGEFFGQIVERVGAGSGVDHKSARRYVRLSSRTVRLESRTYCMGINRAVRRRFLSAVAAPACAAC